MSTFSRKYLDNVNFPLSRKVEMQRVPEWMQKRPGLVIGLALAITGLLAIPFLSMAPTVSASTEPEGPVFEARDLVEDRFASSVYPVFFIVEHDDGDLVSKDGLSALLEAEDALRSDPRTGPTLIEAFDPESETEINGALTIADLVDDALPGGIEGADDATVRAVGAQIIDQLGADTLGLSTRSAASSDGTWAVPAISFPVLADNEELGFGSTSIALGGGTEVEEYARNVQEALRVTEDLTVRGVAIDVNLTSQEQGALAGPFIGFTILAVLLIVGITFRSYWVLAIVGASLGALMIWLKGISNLIGLEDDLVLSLIVPIAMVSFGVDFAFHAIGRYREERRDGLRPGRAFVVGLTAVSGALILALASDTAAFLANISSGIESIIQFGIGAAIALVAAFLLLGIVSPLAVSIVEEHLPAPRPGRRSTLARVAGSVGAGSLIMTSVLLMVFVLPWAGVVAYAATLMVTLLVPYLALRRREAKGRAAELPFQVDRLAGPIGTAVVAFAERRVIVLPVAIGLTAVAAFFAVQVPAEFDVEDFFTSDSEFVQSLDALDDHVGDRGGEPAQVYVEGPLDQPEALARLDSRLAEIRTLDTEQLARRDGAVYIERGVFSVFDAVFASDASLGLIQAESGVLVTDENDDGIPDSSEQVVAVYEVGREFGVPFDAENLALTPDDVRTSIAFDGDGYATVFELGLVDSRAQESVTEARDALTPIAESISDDFDGSFVQVTGSPFVREASLEATNRALQISLPIAVVLCVLVATVFLRSIRFGLVSVVPILMTVSWLYAFMERAGYAINIVTATIAAVSVGIGIDFAIHYIVRYREELGREGERLAAVRSAAEGTGTALVASAISSALGFGILALAPMPLFAAYGLLTAIMIGLALVATLLVLPSLLILVTPEAVSVESPDPTLEPSRA